MRDGREYTGSTTDFFRFANQYFLLISTLYFEQVVGRYTTTYSSSLMDQAV